jgi:hypothetical protein
MSIVNWRARDCLFLCRTMSWSPVGTARAAGSTDAANSTHAAARTARNRHRFELGSLMADLLYAQLGIDNSIELLLDAFILFAKGLENAAPI